MGPSRGHSGAITGSLRGHYGAITGSLRGYYGVITGLLRVHYGLSRGHYGAITGSLRGWYGAITGLYKNTLIILIIALFYSSRYNPGTSIMFQFRNYSLEIELQFIFNCTELIP